MLSPKRVWDVVLDEQEVIPGQQLDIEWFDQNDNRFEYEIVFEATNRTFIVYKGETERIIVSRIVEQLDAQYFEGTFKQYTKGIVASLQGIPLEQTLRSVATGRVAWIFQTDQDGFIVFNDKPFPDNDTVFEFVDLKAFSLDSEPGWGIPQDIYYGETSVFYCGYRKGYITLGKADAMASQSGWVEWSKASDIIDGFDGEVACVLKAPQRPTDPPGLILFMIDSILADDAGVLRIMQFELTEDSFRGFGPYVDDFGNLEVDVLGQITGGDVTGGALQAGWFSQSQTAFLYQYGDDAMYLFDMSQSIIEDEDVLPLTVQKFSTVFPNLNQTDRGQVALNHSDLGLTVVSGLERRVTTFPGFTVESVFYGTDTNYVSVVRTDDNEYE